MESKIPVRALLIGFLAAALVAGGFAAWYVANRGGGDITAGVTSSGSALIGGPFELTDQTGAARNEKDFQGGYMLVVFGYTFCPDVCPTALSTMSQALDILEEGDSNKAEAVTPVFVTVDPERDTVEAMASYAEHFHPKLVALTGTTEQVASAAKAYRVYYKKVDDESATDYLVDHSAFIYLMGPDGGYMTHFNHAATADEMAEGLAKYVKL